MISIVGLGIASRILGALAMAASTDETRPHMNSVLVRAKDGILEVVATNGHVLAYYRAASEELGSGEILLPLGVVERIAKASKKSLVVEIEPETRTARILPDGISFSWPEVYGKFPPFEQVIPAPGGERTLEGFSVSFEYLILTGKIFAALEEKETKKSKAKGTFGGCFLEIPKDADGPIVCSAHGSPLTFVVMPNRVDRNSARKVPAKEEKAA